MTRLVLWILCLLAAAPALPQVRLPQFTRQTLPNGATLILMPRADLPLVTLRVLVRGGAESVPLDLAGLPSATAELLRRGTATRSADQFSEELDFMGATFQASSDEQATQISAEFLSKDADRALDIVADAVRKPAFPEAEVKKVLAQRIDAAKSLKDNPGGAAALYYRAFFYGPQHPYSGAGNGDELTLPRINRQALADYHQRMYVGRNLTIIAVGDFIPAAMTAKLTTAFGAFPPGTAYEWRKDSPPARPGAPRLLLVDKPDATQTYFLIGQPGVHRAHPDRVTLRLVNTLFGGRFTSMLNDELRVNTGLTYGARSQVDEERLTGGVFITTYTKTDTTAKAIDLALDILKRLSDKGINAEQLASAKAYMKGIFPTERLETIDQLAATLAELALFELGRGEIDDLFSKIDAVTPEQASAAARKYYRSDNLTFLLLGNAAKIREAAGKYAPKITEVPVTQPGFGATQ